jgi:hypothetical protein
VFVCLKQWGRGVHRQSQFESASIDLGLYNLAGNGMALENLGTGV